MIISREVHESVHHRVDIGVRTRFGQLTPRFVQFVEALKHARLLLTLECVFEFLQCSVAVILAEPRLLQFGIVDHRVGVRHEFNGITEN